MPVCQVQDAKARFSELVRRVRSEGPQHVTVRGRDEVAWINYAELDDSPCRDLARKYLPEGAGAIFTFGLRGGREAGRAFIEAIELWSHLANVGDAKSLVIHPASTTHQQLSDEELLTSGVGADMVRLSVGLEDPADLTWDLENGLRAAAKVAAFSPA